MNSNARQFSSPETSRAQALRYFNQHISAFRACPHSLECTFTDYDGVEVYTWSCDLYDPCTDEVVGIAVAADHYWEVDVDWC